MRQLVGLGMVATIVWPGVPVETRTRRPDAGPRAGGRRHTGASAALAGPAPPPGRRRHPLKRNSSRG